LSKLQIARAYKLMGDDTTAKEYYEQFLSLWKDADSEIPIYRQAKAEYAQLRLLDRTKESLR
jgi:eukaryotic-like serine/threonine-protein kinase